ncbi:MAG: nucleotidyltransferase domain-containing protein [candidate division WOR-3 bacterium]|nr:MAG: nucleotidyltransferase domain-containing protein [candidate division WOR-3 bacterium]
MKARLRSVLASLRARLEQLYGDRLVKLILYGSQARGDAEPGSDIDVLVVLKGEVQPCQEIERTGDIVASTSLDNNVVVACVFVSEDRYANEWNPLLANVRKEGVAV